MVSVIQVGLVLLGVVASGQSLDDFHYADTAAARQAWVANERTPPVETLRDDGQSAVSLALPFATQSALGRSVIDRRVKLDLAAPGAFLLELTVDDVKALGGITLYFRSGRSWYGASGSIRGSGRQTIRIPKSAFRVEEQPSGWRQIDGIRLAFWRGQPRDAKVTLRRLSSVTGEVALIMPTPHDDKSEAKTVRETAQRVQGMFDELGIAADALCDDVLAEGALGKRPVVVVPYFPHMTDATAKILEQYVASGGKLILCYQLPPRLAKALGFNTGKYVRPERPGTFAQMRFTAPDVPGMPSAVEQTSWNITSAEPADEKARVVGQWYDDQGQASGHAALLLSPRGAFLSHILTGDDPAGKKQLLAALVGHFAPQLWQQMAAQAIESATKVGHLSDVAALASFVSAAPSAEAKQRLEAAQAKLAAARGQCEKKAFPQAIEAARAAHDLLAEAYLRAQPSPAKEGRAVWNHSGTGAYAGDWERSAVELQRAGFNMVLPNMLWGGLAHYASDVLPRSDTFAKQGDQIEQCLAAARRHKLEVHVWKVNWNLSTAPKKFVEEMRAAGRTMVSHRGEPHDWLCPSHPGNLRLEVDSMLEVARKYPVDGLHFDYIRYPGPEVCYCDGCRERFEKDTQTPVAHWPADCHGGPRKEEYRQWRCDRITRLVAAVRAETKKLRPNLKLSAAVFGSYPSCRESVAQDWVEWIRRGYLDFVCPMDYTESDTTFSNLVEGQLGLIEKRIPMYPGIGATASRCTLTADRVAGQIHHARHLGAAGFTMFNFQENTARAILPGLGLGVGTQPATPPHR